MRAAVRSYPCSCSMLCALNRVTSREAAAALMCSEGCLTEEEQSRARAKVPTERETIRNLSTSPGWVAIQ